MVLPQSERSDNETPLAPGSEPLVVPEKEARLTKEDVESLVVKEFFVNIFEDEPEQKQPGKAALRRVFELPGSALISRM